MSTMCIDTSNFDDKLNAIAAAGFDSVELWIKDFKDVKETKRRLKDAGLRAAETVKLEGWFELDGSLMGVADKETAIFDECKRRIEITAELECPYIVALPSRDDRGRYRTIDQGADAYHKLLEIGHSFGVCPTLEFVGQSGQINNINEALRFLDMVSHPFAQLIIDVFHIWRGGDSVDSFQRVPSEKISLLHLHDVSSDYRREEYKDRHRIMPGDGILELDRFVEIASSKGFDGDVSLGVYNHSNWDRNPFEVAQEGYDKMKKVIEAVR